MATLADVLADKNKPDDQKILIEGVEVTLGDLRKSHMMQSDYTRKTMKHSEEVRQFEQDRQAFEQARFEAEAKLTDLAKQVVQQHPMATRTEQESLLEQDPVYAKLSKQQEAADAKLAAIEKAHATLEAAIKKQEMSRYEDQHRQVLNSLRQADPDLDTDELINYARTHYIGRLDDAYRSMRFETAVESAKKAAKEEGLKEGLERGKREISQPLIPSRRVLTPMNQEKPVTWDSAVDAALSDPDVVNPLMTGLPSGL